MGTYYLLINGYLLLTGRIAASPVHTFRVEGQRQVARCIYGNKATLAAYGG